MSRRKIELPQGLIKDYTNSNLTVIEILNKYNMRLSTLHQLLDANGIPKRPHINRINLPIEEIKEIYLAGYSLEEIGKIFYVSPNLIYKRLKEIGINCTYRINFRKKQIKELLKDKTLNIEDIADIVKIDPQTVRLYAKEMNITIPTVRKIILDTKIPRERFIKIYNKYDMYKDIANTLKISTTTVTNYAKLLNLPLKPSRRFVINESNQEKFIELYNNNENTLISIAIHFNTSVNVIKDAAKRLSLPRRRKPYIKGDNSI